MDLKALACFQNQDCQHWCSNNCVADVCFSNKPESDFVLKSNILLRFHSLLLCFWANQTYFFHNSRPQGALGKEGHYPFSKLNLYLLSDFQVFKRRCTYSNSRPFPALKRRRNSLKEKHQTHLGSVLRHRVGVWMLLCGAGGWNWQSLWIPFNLGYSMIHLIIWLQELRHSLQNLARPSTQESRSVPIKRKGQEWKKQRQPSNIKRWICKELDS